MQVGRADVQDDASTAMMLACLSSRSAMLMTLQSISLVDDIKP